MPIRLWDPCVYIALRMTLISINSYLLSEHFLFFPTGLRKLGKYCPGDLVLNQLRLLHLLMHSNLPHWVSDFTQCEKAMWCELNVPSGTKNGCMFAQPIRFLLIFEAVKYQVSSETLACWQCQNLKININFGIFACHQFHHWCVTSHHCC